MANHNKITIAGQLGADAELKYTSGDNPKPVMELSVATTEEWMDKNTAKIIKRTQWHRVVYWGGKHAEALVNKLKLQKGDSVLVEGSMDYSSYPIKKKDGIDLPVEVNIPTAKIKAVEVQLLRRANANISKPSQSAASDNAPADDSQADAPTHNEEEGF